LSPIKVAPRTGARSVGLRIIDRYPAPACAKGSGCTWATCTRRASSTRGNYPDIPDSSNRVKSNDFSLGRRRSSMAACRRSSRSAIACGQRRAREASHDAHKLERRRDWTDRRARGLRR
jgi:hypothetical protein